MTWPEHLDNPKHLAAFYDGTQGLDAISLHEATFHRDGPCLRIRGTLARFPDRPSPRWPKEANRAQLVLSFWGLHELSLHGADTVIDGILSINADGGRGLRFSFKSRDLAIQGTCDLVRLDSLAAYIEST